MAGAVVRICASCAIEDSLYYDISQICHCVSPVGIPIGEADHDAAHHLPDCPRLRHRVGPYRKRLRSFRSTDGVPDEYGKFDLPSEFAYLKSNGFTALKHSGFLWAEKMICKPCIVLWDQRQALRRDYEARCAALRRDAKPHEYEQMICF